MTEFKRDQQGVERCQRVVDTVQANDPKNPALGFKPVKAYCNKPMTLSVSEGRKVCPDCEKPPTVGWPTPRVTNAAGVSLTKKELEECGVSEDTSLVSQPVAAVRKPRVARKAVEAKVKKEIKKDVVSFEVSLSILEENEDVAATLIRSAIEGMDKLPVTNFAESKRLIRLQEKLEALVRA